MGRGQWQCGLGRYSSKRFGMSYQITESCTGCTVCARNCPVEAISGERKELHVIDPQLCIDCGTCGRVCAFSAVLDEHKSLATRMKKEQWLRPHWNYGLCVACVICVTTCPTGSIALAGLTNKNSALPNQPLLAVPETCIGCSLCAKACPTDAILMY